MSGLIIRLRDLILLAFKDEEFAMLLFEHVNVSDWDYAGLPAWTYEKKVFETILWADRYGQATQVLWLARLVASRRSKRADLATLVADIEAMVEPPAAKQPQPAPVAAQPAGLPQELTASLRFLDEKHFTLRDLLVDVRPRLRAISYHNYDLPGQFHLSDSEGRRLLAVLALEAEPDATYLRWLSERVSVEEPVVGLTAAQSLTSAALRLSVAEVARVRTAAVTAADRLDALIELDDDVVPGADVAARKRQLDLAVSIGEMRLKKGKSLMQPHDVDAFLGALLKTFDRERFDQMFKRQMGTDLKWVASLEDPWELIVAAVVVTARDKGWERDLIRAAYAEVNEAAFATMHQKYAAGV